MSTCVCAGFLFHPINGLLDRKTSAKRYAASGKTGTLLSSAGGVALCVLADKDALRPRRGPVAGRDRGCRKKLHEAGTHFPPRRRLWPVGGAVAGRRAPRVSGQAGRASVPGTGPSRPPAPGAAETSHNARFHRSCKSYSGASRRARSRVPPPELPRGFLAIPTIRLANDSVPGTDGTLAPAAVRFRGDVFR